MTAGDRVTAAGGGPAPGEGQPAAGGPRGGTARQAGPNRVRQAAWLAGLAAAAVALFLCYLHQSRSVAIGSDGASNALQAWDMLHGNLLLHGWVLSDVSFYTTELPEYVIVEAVRGLAPDAVHVAGALTYTVLVLLAGLVAKGRATGWPGVIRFLIASGIMLAPEISFGTYTLLLSPDHVGTQVLLLLVWLVIDRAWGRWYVPAVAGLLLAWVQVADALALYIGVVPIVVICLLRAGRGLAGRDRAVRARLAGSRYDLVMAAAALASAGVSSLAVRLISNSGGYIVHPPSTKLGGWGPVPAHFAVAGRSILELFGANLTTAPPGPGMFFAAVHLAGVILAAGALGLAIVHIFRAGEPLVPGLAVAILVNLGAFIASTQAIDIPSSREIAGVLPFGAVLAGRLLTGPLARARRPVRLALGPLGAACLICYAAALGYGAAQAPVPAQNSDLVSFLAAHGLRSGLSGYWQANSETLDTGGRIVIRSVTLNARDRVTKNNWETKTSWYDPRTTAANFVVTVSRPASQAWELAPFEARDTFGVPARTYQFGRYTVMVWNTNLLARLAASTGP
ncbi:MAG TPA: hypothetical protein VG268_13420 [Streptosporangiaceae bacterium]|nr:hypothetical protein [Streptosporangiaceae bacterium]